MYNIESNVGGFRAGFLRVRKGARRALINIHTNEGGEGCWGYAN